MSNSSYRGYLVTILALLSFSTILPGLAYAQPLAVSAEDWQYVNGGSWAGNYSPQDQIVKSNVDQMEVKWIFPLEGTNSASSGMQAISGLRQGSSTPPIVVDGKVFITTNYMRTYAVDATTGKQIWENDYEIDIDDLESRLPVQIGSPHLHGIRFWEAEDVVLISGMACDFYGINAQTGETSFHVQDLCSDVPGNIYTYNQGIMASSNQANIGTYDKGNQFTYVIPGAIHSRLYDGDGRHVTMGIDMDSYEIKWRVYSFPPQDVLSPNWALEECDIGFFQDIPCSDVAASNPENLEWDWAFPDELPSKWGGVTANWGQTIVDEDTGLMYTNTGNQGPYTNVSMTPGPRLYGSTLMAINMNTGMREWWLQPFPRDPYDYDCNWGGVLAESPTLGKVYMKGCKEGMLYVVDAATGEPHYVVDVVNEQAGWGQITQAGTLEPWEGGVKYHLNDPFSYYDMREMKAPDGSKYCGSPCTVYPYWYNGVFATDMSYDPNTDTLFHYAMALQTTITSPNYEGPGSVVSRSTAYPVTNTTIVARDVATGDVKWTYFMPEAPQRAHMIVTKELLIVGGYDGLLRFHDINTGNVLKEINVGSDFKVGVTTGQDSNGDQKIFTNVGAGPGLGAIGPATPMTLVAFGLSEGARITTVTSTTTATTTATTTSISTTATTSTVTTATTSTVTTTGMASTTTVTSEVTEETGLPAEVTYAAIAVAVIAIIAAAVLTMRKR